MEGLLLRQFGDWGQVPMKNHDLSRSLVSHYLSFLPCVITLALSLFEKPVLLSFVMSLSYQIFIWE